MTCGGESHIEVHEMQVNRVPSGRERLEEVIGMRKIGYPVGEKVMRKSMKQRKMVDSDRGMFKWNQQEHEKRQTSERESPDRVNKFELRFE